MNRAQWFTLGIILISLSIWFGFFMNACQPPIINDNATGLDFFETKVAVQCAMEDITYGRDSAYFFIFGITCFILARLEPNQKLQDNNEPKQHRSR